jgi:two-component system response regulator FixJ
MMRRQQKIFYVDGQARAGAVRRALAGSRRHVTHFTSTADCLASIRARVCHLLILSVSRGDSAGLHQVIEAREAAPWLPIVVLVDRADIKTAVRVMKAGAADCLERPLDLDQLGVVVESALDLAPGPERPQPGQLSAVEERVLRLTLEGRTCKEIGALLYRSPRTIEAHRRRLKEKLGATNVVDLVRKAVSLGWLRA